MSAEFLCSIEPIDLTGTLDQSLLDELAAICCFALNAEAPAGDWEVALVLTTDEHMAAVARRVHANPCNDGHHDLSVG